MNLALNILRRIHDDSIMLGAKCDRTTCLFTKPPPETQKAFNTLRARALMFLTANDRSG